MDFRKMALRVAGLDVALPEGWRLMTDEQIEEVMALLPPGSTVYGSYATGRAHPGSDLDVKLPSDVGERALSRLMMTVMGKVDLPNGAVNLSMPCSQHEGCAVLAHVNEVHLLPPLIEHLTGGLVDPDELPEDKKEARRYKREHYLRFIEEMEDDEEIRPSAMDKRALQKFLAGAPPEEILEEWGEHLDPDTLADWVESLREAIGD